MKFFSYSTSAVLVLSLVILACVEPYFPGETSGNPDLLVVDGFLNASSNSSRVVLSRTVPLVSEADPAPVSQAIVSIEEEGGGKFTLMEGDAGVYSGTVNVNTSRRYRLTIRSAGRDYSSSWEEVFITPPIEEIAFRPGDETLDIMVNTSDPTGKNKYFRWTFAETWEYFSPYYSGYEILPNEDIVERTVPISRCWRTDPAFRIFIASSDQLTSNVIRNFTLSRIPRTSIKISSRYSVSVRQFAISESAYTYLLNLQKTTESLGGLFDPMPGRVIGNISSSNPSEPVIGYFNAGTVDEKRIFVTPRDLPERFVQYRGPFCEYDTLMLSDRREWPSGPLLLFPVYSMTGQFPIGYTAAETNCADCRVLGGGTITKPEFWP